MTRRQKWAGIALAVLAVATVVPGAHAEPEPPPGVAAVPVIEPVVLGEMPHDPMAFIVGRELYGHLEKIVDRFEDVANEIQGLVIDHA